MSIRFSCSSCGKKYSVKPELAGRKARCMCSALNVVPSADADFVALDVAEVPTPTRAAPAPRRPAASAPNPDSDFISIDMAVETPARPSPASSPASQRPRTSSEARPSRSPAAGASAKPKTPPPLNPAPLPFDFADNEPVQRLPDTVERSLCKTSLAPVAAAPTRAQRAAETVARTAPKRSYAPKSNAGRAAAGGGAFTLLAVLGIILRVVNSYYRHSHRDDAPTPSSAVVSHASPRAEAVPPPPAIHAVAAPARVEPVPHGPYRDARVDVRNCAGTITHLDIMLPPGQHAKGSLPCVFVAPAGTPLIWGNELESNYTDESLPYVRAGFAVVRYSLSGAVPGDPENTPDNIIEGYYRQFRDASAGVADCSAAIDVAIGAYPEIDAKRLYTAGHSSAGNVALLAARKDSRIRACVAYAPATDVRKRFQSSWSDMQALPGFEQFVHDSSPMEVGAPRCPTLIFHADDDGNVPASDAKNFASTFSSTVKLHTVPSGGHIESMLRDGIPAGIRFLVDEQHALDAAKS
jgi:dienelactone hydrolase